MRRFLARLLVARFGRDARGKQGGQSFLVELLIKQQGVSQLGTLDAESEECDEVHV